MQTGGNQQPRCRTMASGCTPGKIPGAAANVLIHSIFYATAASNKCPHPCLDVRALCLARLDTGVKIQQFFHGKCQPTGGDDATMWSISLHEEDGEGCFNVGKQASLILDEPASLWRIGGFNTFQTRCFWIRIVEFSVIICEYGNNCVETLFRRISQEKHRNFLRWSSNLSRTIISIIDNLNLT